MVFERRRRGYQNQAEELASEAGLPPSWGSTTKVREGGDVMRLIRIVALVIVVGTLGALAAQTFLSLQEAPSFVTPWGEMSIGATPVEGVRR